MRKKPETKDERGQTYQKKYEISLPICSCIHHESTWGNGGLAPHILKLDTRYK